MGEASEVQQYWNKIGELVRPSCGGEISLCIRKLGSFFEFWEELSKKRNSLSRKNINLLEQVIMRKILFSVTS